MDDLAEEIAGEADQRSPEQVLLAALDSTEDSKLTGFALRLALTSHVGIRRDGAIDFLSEAETIFTSPQLKAIGARKLTPIKTSARKTAAKKKAAA